MNITKAFTTSKESKEFKNKYSSGDIETEVVSNLLQPHYAKNHQQLEEYMEFIFGSTPEHREIFSLNMFTNHYALPLLKEYFGKHDFKYEGNRTYTNYVLKFEDLILVAPTKIEVVVTPKPQNLIDKLIRFEKEFKQLLLDCVMTHYDELDLHEKDIINNLKKYGVINKENQINFKYFTEKTKPQLKMK